MKIQPFMATLSKHSISDSFPHLLLISASAGSGKTEALARRYLRFVLSGDVPHRDIANILAITFTRMAVREMKERILELLKKLALGLDRGLTKDLAGDLGVKPGAMPEMAAGALQKILGRYSDFQVTTIDAFDNRLVSAAAMELDLAPQSQVTTDYGELAPLALDSMLRAMAEDTQAAEAVREYVELLNNLSGESFVWRPAQKLEENFLRFLAAESKLAGRLQFRDTRAGLEAAFAEMAEALDDIRSLAAKGKIELKDLGKLAEAVKGRTFEGLSGRKFTDGTVPCYARDKSAPAWPKIAAVWSRFPELRASAAEARAEGYYHPYGRCFRLFQDHLRQAKSRAATIHMDDMARMLAGLLDSDNLPDIYLRLGARLHHYLMDEFQDTDPQQWRGLLPLLEEAVAGQGSLFLVGDLKQAIYQFREADYRIMLQLAMEIKGQAARSLLPASVADRAELRELPLNHRSGGTIVDYAASAFKRRLPELIDQGVYRPNVTGLTTYFQESRPDLTGMGFVSARHPGPDGDMDEWAKQQTLSIINDAHSRGYGYGRMAILAPQNKDLQQAVAWLTGAGIPATSSGALDIRERRAPAELAALLKFLDSPVDDLAFASFLSGDVFRLSLDGKGDSFGPAELASVVLAAIAGGRRLYQAFREHPEGNRIWQEKLETLYQRVGHYPLYDLLTLACESFGVWRTLPGEAAAILKMLEAANDLAEDGRNGVRDFLELWQNTGGDEFSLELPEYIEAVRAFTVHSAKGLGFPVVINLVHGRPKAGLEVRHNEGNDLRLLYVPKYLAECSDGLAVALDEELAEDEVQFLNGLYVSCTRARDELYVLVLPKDDKDPLLRLFPVEEMGAKRTTDKSQTQAPEPCQPQSFGGPGYPDRPERWSRGRAADARRGKWHHRALEHIEYLTLPPKDEAAAAVQKAERSYGPMPDGERALEALAKFLALPEAADAFAKKEGRAVLREADFVDAHGHLHRMDRVVINRDQVTLWEFKTGEPRDHSRQVGIYRELLQAAYPDKKTAIRIAYLDNGMVEEAP